MKVNFRKTAAGYFTGTIEIDGLVLSQGLLSQTEAETLLEEFEAAVSRLKQLLNKSDKPTVVVNIDGGFVAYVEASCEVDVVVVDQDIEGYSDTVKDTPIGHKAVVYLSSADIVTKERIATWLDLANQ
mgnify:CR=1 FL=1